MRRSLRNLMSSSVVLAMTTAMLTPLASQANAADPPDPASAAGLLTALQGSGGVADFLDGLAPVGAFSSSAPGLTLVPGAGVGLGQDDLLATALSAAPGLGAADSPAAIAAALNNGGNGYDIASDEGPDAGNPLADRHVKWSASASKNGTVSQLTLTLIATRTVPSGLFVDAKTQPFSFSTGDGLAATLTETDHVVVDFDTSNSTAWVEPGNLSVAASVNATPDGLDKADAAIGILGVTLDPSSTYTDVVTIAGSVRDPNNDGRLTLGGGSELGADGASSGLGTVALTQPGGTLSNGSGGPASLKIVPRPAELGQHLPSVTATVAVSDADWAANPNPTATVTAGDLTAAQAFETLSSFDLVQGVAQLSATLHQIQGAHPTTPVTLDLPFLKGSVADIVPASEALDQFLLEHATTNPDKTKPGTPDFASFQEMFAELEGTTGPIDPVTKKDTQVYAVSVDFQDVQGAGTKHPSLPFVIHVKRDAPTSQSADPAADLFTGGPSGVTYDATSITDTDPSPAWAALGDQRDVLAATLVGRQVTIGASSAQIDKVTFPSGAIKIALDPAPLKATPSDPNPATYWKGGTPAAGQAYIIAGGDPQTGLVQLADQLKATSGLHAANADRPQATIIPTYTLDLPISLDLSPAVSGLACGAADQAGQVCPFQRGTGPNHDGPAQVISEWPIRSNRFQLVTGQHLLAATAALTTPVDVTAPVGYVPVHVTTGSGTPLTESANITISTLTPGGKPAAQALSDVFAYARDNADAIETGSVSGTASAPLQLHVVGDDGFYVDGSSNPRAGSATLTQAFGAASPTIADPNGDLGTLKVLDVTPGTDNALFGVLLADLGQVSTALRTPATSGDLGTPFPLLGTSAGALLAAQDTRFGSGILYRKHTPLDAATPDTCPPVTPDSKCTLLEITQPGATFGPSDIGRTVTVGSFQAPIIAATGSTVLLPTLPASIPADGTPFSVSDGLAQSVNVFTAAPPSDLAALLAQLNTALGGTANAPAASFTVDTASKVMTLTLDWKQSAAVRSPLNLAIKVSSGDAQIAGDAANGAVPISSTTHNHVVLHIPLDKVAAPADALTVDKAASSRTLEAKVDNSGGYDVTVSSLRLKLQPGAVKADVGVTAKAAGTGDAKVGDWAAGLAPTQLNAGLPAVQCGGSDASICASLPIKSNDGATDYGSLSLTMPTGSTSDYKADLDPTTAGRTGALTDLDNALKTANFDIAPFGDALSQYVDVARKGLDVATAGGRFPLIGKDLQQGQDFLGKLHDKLATGFGASNLATFGDVVSNLHTALQAVPNLKTGSDKVEGACTVVVLPPSKPTTSLGSGDVSKLAASDTAMYSYQVFGVLANGSATALSPPSDAVKSAKVLDASKGFTITVSWSGSSHFDHYVLYRDAGDGGGQKPYSKVTGTSFVDPTGPVVAPTETPGAGNVTFTGPCIGTDPAPAIDSVTVGADFGQGSFDTTNGCTNSCLSSQVPLDLGLPGLSLKAYNDSTAGTTDAAVTASLGWQIDLSVTLDKHKGLLFELNKPGFDGNKLQVGAKLDVADSIKGDLSFLKVDLNDQHQGQPLLKGEFDVNLVCPTATCANNQVALTSLTGDAFAPNVTAAVDVDELAKVRADDALPGLQAEFKLSGAWSSANKEGDGLLDGGGLKISLDNIGVDPGSMLNSTLYPIVRNFANAIKPLQPILDTVTAPIPVLSDLSHAAGGGDVTILSLAESFADDGSDSDSVGKVIEVIKKLTQLATFLNKTASGGAIPLGNIDLAPDKVEKTANSPDVADSFIKQGKGAPGTPGNPSSILGDLDSAVGGSSGVNLESSGPDSSDTDPNTSEAGVTFPAFENPRELIDILVGGDATLAKFDSGQLTVGFSFSESFGPVYAPPPVMVVISGSASVTLHVVAGFDTVGIRQAVESGNVAQVLNGLFFYTTDDQGRSLPVVTFHGELAAGAEVSVVFLSVGVEGGISLTVNFTWADPNNDGKFRFSEFLAAAMQNPLCLFNVGGELDLFIKVFVTIGFSPFDVSFDFNLVNIKLLDFSIKPNCQPDPPKLAGYTDDKTLYLYAGKLGNGYRGDSLWDANDHDETWVVHETFDKASGTTYYAVKALGFEQDFPKDKVDRIVLDGRGYKGKLNVLLQGYQKDVDGKPQDQPFDATAYIWGGENQDSIKTADGAAFIDGGPGDDTITTGENAHPEAFRSVSAKVAGNGGADHISTGNGDDQVAGDGALDGSGITGDVDTSSFGAHPAPKAGQTQAQQPYVAEDPVKVTIAGGTGVLKPSTVSGLAPGAGGDPAANTSTSQSAGGRDVIQVGLGTNTVYGGPDDDTISVADDSPLVGTAVDTPALHAHLVDGVNHIYGNAGSDKINAGSNSDVIYTGEEDPASSKPIQDNPGSTDARGEATGVVHDASTTNTVDTGEGSDTVYGSQADDLIIGHSLTGQQDTIYGAGGEDVLVGGQGSDHVYGGPGNDYLSSDPATPVLTHGGVVDQISSQAGKPDWVFQPSSAPKTTVSKTLVGGGGADRIFGGNGPSALFGDHDTFTDGTGTHDDPCVKPTVGDQSDRPDEHPRDATNESDSADRDAADLIVGGAGDDTVQAGGGADWVYGTNGTNLMCGEGGNDHIFGGTGVDTAFGGTGSDVMQGYAGDDFLYGNESNDFLYGNEGNDVLEGNEGTDTIFGGQDADTIVGGTTTQGRRDASDPAAVPVQQPSDGGDVLYGDTGTDLMIGDNGKPDGSGGATLFDLAEGNGTSIHGGPDTIYGGDDADQAYGGLDQDVIHGGNGADHLEGNDAHDTIFGDADPDDIVGGSSQVPADTPTTKDVAGYPDAADTIDGGSGDDVVTGDNAQITDVSTATADSVLKGRSMTVGRHVVLYDLGYAPTAGTSGGDTIVGGTEPDGIYGQAGIDNVHGDAGDDYIEGDQGADVLAGDAGEDDIAGGSSYAESGTGQATAGQLDTGDSITGGDDADVILGDNGLVTRDPAITPSDITRNRLDADLSAAPVALRSIQPYDLGDSPTASTSGGDYIEGDDGSDMVLGQSGNDRITGGNDGDYAEGGPGADWIQGDGGDDDLVGGSSTILGTDPGNDTAAGQPDTGDVVWGGNGDDLITGDNSVTNRAGAPSPYLTRVGSSGRFVTQRYLRLLDLKPGATYLVAPTRPVAGADLLSGGGGVDVMFGQDGDDKISGGGGEDYAEGNGGHDVVYGDRTLADAGIVPTHPTPDWPTGTVMSDGTDTGAPYGQDDLIGGSSIQSFRDTADEVHGDGGADFILGDDGVVRRDIVDQTGKAVALTTDLTTVSLPLGSRIYAKRYDPAHLPAGAAYVRHGVVTNGVTAPTRFCTTAQATCEPAGAFGDDLLWGDGGSDTVYGQDGNDHIYGDTGATGKNPDGAVDDHTQADDDDLYGELGDDVVFGEDGQDAILGDRGGIVDVWQSGSSQFTVDNSQVPQIHYVGFQPGTVTRQVDLQHDVQGDSFLGTATAAVIPHRGDLEGGNDQLRGGNGNDAIHGGFGDDLVNGDSGGDTVFGDDGADVLWGGKGCDQSVDTAAVSPDCYKGGAFDPAARGTGDRLVDYINGGKGATSGPSVNATTGDLGSDIIDWHPRGTYTSPGKATTCTDQPWPATSGNGKTATTVDPCVWFLMTNLDDADVANNQHHQGIDWMYGGWDRDILQGDVADNGPNQGDRLLDWTGAYNLYTHCNAAYGGYNDVRQFSPDMQSFLQQWAWSLGAGRASTDVTTSGTSAFDELALVYQSDINAHGSGSAFPSTPGHFDDPNACAP